MIGLDSRVGAHVFKRMVSLEPQIDRNLVVVGDPACGKTSLLQRFINGTYREDYEPTVFDNYMAEVDLDVATVDLALWDTAGAQEHDALRPLSYPNKDVVMVCFSISDPSSLDQVEKKWIPEIRHNCPGVPVLLVGLQKESRKDKNILQKLQREDRKPVSHKAADAVADRIDAYMYVECSARTGKGVEDVFLAAAKLSLLKRT